MSGNNASAAVVEQARAYYNSEDADNFYFHIWGGEDIHVGIYEHEGEDIATASRRTVATMAEQVAGRLGPGARVLDLGAGYGGAARYLAERFGCHVTAINLAEAENERHRQMNAAAGLSERIEVVDGNFEQLPFDDASFDVVWSQDAILHSGRRAAVIAEVARVLKPHGEFIFTDPMQSDDADPASLRPVLERIHLDTLGSIGFYRHEAGQHGLEEVAVKEMTEQLVNHYSSVRRELERNRAKLADRISDDYIERMLTGLGHWVEAGRAGRLAWGIMRFRKPA